MNKFIFVLSVVLCSSCDKVNGVSNTLEGTYVGYFHRNNNDTTQVTLYFSGTLFSGSSKKYNYPALGKGSFEMKEDCITFNDSCTWLNNVDGTLVLKGEYYFEEFIDGTSRIWRKQNGVLDEYVLRRPFY